MRVSWLKPVPPLACFFLFTFVLTANSCSQKNGLALEDPEPFQGFVVKVKGTDWAQVAAEPIPVPCSPSGPTGHTAGACLSPVAVSAQISALAVGTGGTFHRLYGSELSVPLKNDGSVDQTPLLLSGTTLSANSGELSSASEEWWDRVILYTTQLDVRARIKGEYWTFRYSFVPSSPLVESAIDGCIGDAAFRDDITYAASQATVAANRGDVLFCRRADSGECAPSDFRWFDMRKLAFASSRPGFDTKYEDPATRAFAVCAQDGAAPRGYRIDLQGVRLVASLADPFRITRTAEGGYRFLTRSGLTGTSKDLRVVVSFSVSNWVQLAKLGSDLTPVSAETIAKTSTLSVLSSLFHNATVAEPPLTANIKFDTVSP